MLRESEEIELVLWAASQRSGVRFECRKQIARITLYTPTINGYVWGRFEANYEILYRLRQSGLLIARIKESLTEKAYII